jgi:phosphoribosylformylglycinamidine synthase
MALNDAIISGLILSARNIADGGVAVALATMSFTKEIGIDINIPDDLSNEIKLFSESCGFVLEVDKANIVAIRNIFHKYGIATEMIGHTISEPELRMQDCINIAIADAKAAWEDGLRNKLL